MVGIFMTELARLQDSADTDTSLGSSSWTGGAAKGVLFLVGMIGCSDGSSYLDSSSEIASNLFEL